MVNNQKLRREKREEVVEGHGTTNPGQNCYIKENNEQRNKGIKERKDGK